MSKIKIRAAWTRSIALVLAAGGICWGADVSPTSGPTTEGAWSAGPTTAPVARFVISEFGAVADGKTVNTAAIQKVIDDAAAGGGGTVVVPGGTFLTGAIFLKPGVGLFVEKDGVLKGSTDLKDYPIGRTRIEGHFQDWVPALVNAEGVDHLRIGGEGTLDGSGAPFYAAFRSKVREVRGTKNLDVPRPRLVYVSNSADVRVEGLHFLNSGFWNLHVYHCHDVVIDGLDILAPSNSPSTDGVDVDSCQWVTIHGCRISNNDDGIALKGSKGPMAMEDADSPPVEHIHVYDCVFEHGGSFVTCGSEATIVRDVEVDHCKAVGNGGMCVMRLKLRTDTPQLYEDLHFHDITLQGRGSIFGMSPWTQYADLQGHAPPTHTVRNISMSNITGTYGSFGSIKPNPGDGIENFTLENIDLTVQKEGAPMAGVSGLVVKNVKINGEEFTGAGQ